MNLEGLGSVRMKSETVESLGHVRLKSETVYGKCILIEWDGKVFVLVLSAGSAFKIYYICIFFCTAFYISFIIHCIICLVICLAKRINK